MSDNNPESTWRISALIPTVRFGNVRVSANDWTELDEVLSDGAMDDVLAKLRLLTAEDQVRATFPGTTDGPADDPKDGTASYPNRNRTQYGRRKQAAQANEAGGDVGEQFCNHGPMKFYDSGTWKAWFCPLDKGDPNACQPRDGRTGEEWAQRR